MEPQEISKLQKIGALKQLLLEFDFEDIPGVTFDGVIIRFESRIHLYIVERRDSRTLMRFGDQKEILLLDHDFCEDFIWGEWFEYVESRKKQVRPVLEEMLKSLENESNHESFSER